MGIAGGVVAGGIAGGAGGYALRGPGATVNPAAATDAAMIHGRLPAVPFHGKHQAGILPDPLPATALVSFNATAETRACARWQWRWPVHSNSVWTRLRCGGRRGFTIEACAPEAAHFYVEEPIGAHA